MKIKSDEDATASAKYGVVLVVVVVGVREG